MMQLFLSNRRCFWGFVAILVASVISHLATLSFSPLPWFDEVVITEMTRGGITHAPWDFGMLYGENDAVNSQSWAIFYVGGWIQGSAYRIFGECGPRIASLAALVLLTVIGFAYALRRTGDMRFSALFGIILSSYPLFVESARSVRPDMWAQAILFAALYLLDCVKDATTVKRRVALVLFGMLAALSVFVWITSVFFVFVYLWALVDFGRKDLFRSISLAAFGALVATLMLLIPFYPTFGQSCETFLSILGPVSGATVASMTRGQALCSFATDFLGFPFAVLLGTALLVLSRQRLLQAGMVLFFAVCVIVCSRMYTFRFIYVLPFALIPMVLYFSEEHKRKTFWMRCMAVVAFFCVVRGVVMRNGIEYLAKDGRNADAVQTALERHVGRNVRIYCETQQLYYIGKKLGWKPFCFTKGLCKSSHSLADLGIDWFVGETDRIGEEERGLLARNGFAKVQELSFAPPGNWRTRTLELFGRPTCYGPYAVYRHLPQNHQSE